ncbi:MAG: hypothetical protein KDC83_08970 [Flavobacteriales bacterium]|nr:hypothetical protein [Flavobacteriales bacterium]
MKLAQLVFFLICLSAHSYSQERWKYYPFQTQINSLQEVDNEIWAFTDGGVITINKNDLSIGHINMVDHDLASSNCKSFLQLSDDEAYLMHRYGFSIKRYGRWYPLSVRKKLGHKPKSSIGLGVWDENTLIYATWDSLQFISRENYSIKRSLPYRYTTITNYGDTSIILHKDTLYYRSNNGLLKSFHFDKYYSISSTIKLDRENNPWILSHYPGIYQLQNDSFKLHNFEDNKAFKTGQVSGFCPINNEKVWFAVQSWDEHHIEGGIYIWNPSTQSLTREPFNGTETSDFSLVHEDYKGQLWVVDRLGNILVKRNGNWAKIDLSTKMLPNSTLGLLGKTNEGTVFFNIDNWNNARSAKHSWIYSFEDGGITEKFKSNQEERVLAFCFDQNDSIHIRTTSTITGPQKIIETSKYPHETEPWLRFLKVDNSGNYFTEVPTYRNWGFDVNMSTNATGDWKKNPSWYYKVVDGLDGKYWLLGNTIQSFNKDGLVDSIVVSSTKEKTVTVSNLVEDKIGSIWYLLERSIYFYHLENGKLDSFKIDSIYPFLNGAQITQGNSPGEFWIEIFNHLYHFEAGQMKSIPFGNTPLLNYDDYIRDLEIDYRGNLYFLSRLGIYVYNEKGIYFPITVTIPDSVTKAFPNPFVDRFSIPLELSSLSKTEVRIFSIQGELIRTHQFEAFEKEKQFLEIDMTGRRGLFIYEVKTGESVKSGIVIGQ